MKNSCSFLFICSFSSQVSGQGHTSARLTSPNLYFTFRVLGTADIVYDKNHDDPDSNLFCFSTELNFAFECLW